MNGVVKIAGPGDGARPGFPVHDRHGGQEGENPGQGRLVGQDQERGRAERADHQAEGGQHQAEGQGAAGRRCAAEARGRVVVVLPGAIFALPAALVVGHRSFSPGQEPVWGPSPGARMVAGASLDSLSVPRCDRLNSHTNDGTTRSTMMPTTTSSAAWAPAGAAAA